ncbi:MAG: ATP synthase subunit I [Burkholderiaceae bacterium]|nr:ATP synthase subunit I [Burkholderiaceae bacterium]
MLIAVVLQAVITLLAGCVVWLVWGPIHALSLAAGGGSIVIPNALLALRIKTSPPRFAPIVLLVGEFVKIGLTVLLLWLSSRWIVGLSWGAMIVGIILALKALLLTPWCQRWWDQHRASDIRLLGE